MCLPIDSGYLSKILKTKRKSPFFSSAKTLVISFVGMKTQEVAVKPNIKVFLESDTEILDEVVVTGYGVQRKASFTGAATVVGDEILAKKTDANFVKALEGAVPGVQMNNSSSMPGVWGSIYVRGRGSLNSGTQPLYVIDGMPVNSDTDENSLTVAGSSNNSLDPMSSLNPADIESITVLKDAAATAIYGSRAANGVIVVTTKKGSEGQFNINLDIKQGFVTTANNNMDFANAQQTMNLFTDGYTAAYGGDWQANYDYLADDYYGWGYFAARALAEKVFEKTEPKERIYEIAPLQASPDKVAEFIKDWRKWLK